MKTTTFASTTPTMTTPRGTGLLAFAGHTRQGRTAGFAGASGAAVDPIGASMPATDQATRTNDAQGSPPRGTAPV